MKKVLIAQTGSIEYVPDDYYERYKDEGLVLVPEDVEDIPQVAKQIAQEVPKVKKVYTRKAK